MKKPKITTWNQIVYSIISKNFTNNIFTLQEVYEHVPKLEKMYPNNNTIKASIRRNLQELRDKGLITFIENNKGTYQLIEQIEKKDIKASIETPFEVNSTLDSINSNVIIRKNLVYLLHNESFPLWHKIGITSQLDKRLSILNTAVPTSFEVIDFIEVDTRDEALKLEKMIHNLLNEANPDKKSKEFFNITVEQGKYFFDFIKNYRETLIM